jgi:hypothetical protein
MDPFPVVMVLLWHQMFSGFKRPMAAEADTWILDYEDLFEYKAYPAVYCVCGG